MIQWPLFCPAVLLATALEQLAKGNKPHWASTLQAVFTCLPSLFFFSRFLSSYYSATFRHKMQFESHSSSPCSAYSIIISTVTAADLTDEPLMTGVTPVNPSTTSLTHCTASPCHVPLYKWLLTCAKLHKPCSLMLPNVHLWLFLGVGAKLNGIQNGKHSNPYSVLGEQCSRLTSRFCFSRKKVMKPACLLAHLFQNGAICSAPPPPSYFSCETIFLYFCLIDIKV